MPETADATLLVTLQEQARDLGSILHRLELARRDLVPPPATFWRGSARAAYNIAMNNIGTTVDAGIAALTSAQSRTLAAAAEVADRG